MKITGIIFWAIGIVLLGVGAYMVVREKLFLQSSEQATATVTGNQSYTYTSSDYGVQHYYYSEFQFETKAGQSISIRESDGNGNQGGCAELDAPPDYQTGQQVLVYYDPRNPTDTAQIPKAVSMNYYGGEIVLVIAFICIVIGLIFFGIGLPRSRSTTTFQKSH
ncbi:MAG TPA: DUF3592 domain-containing protein [Anaerolineales bacterium]